MYHAECTITLEDVEMLTCLPMMEEVVCAEYEKEGSAGPGCVDRFWGETPKSTDLTAE
ncbi:hypothetical protein LINGRAHAP2_LOCUS4805 [Linum grandiflorum]